MPDLFGDSGFNIDDATQALGVDLGGGGIDFSNLGSQLSNLGGVPQWNWLTKGMSDFNWPGSGGSNWWDAKNIDPWMNVIGKAGVIGKTGFDVFNSIERQKQMADYNKAVEAYYKQQGDYVKQQQDYLKAKQQWESGFMDQFGGAMEEFEGAKGEFQGQIDAASAHAQEVMGQYLAAAKPLLAQSQELLVPGVAALARGETPEQWQPILNEARHRGMAAMVQSMVSAGMSPEEAQAAAQPVAEQQAQTMLLQLATSMITQGGQLSQIGMAGLGGAGQLTQIMGQLASLGFAPEATEFQAMASVLGHILGQNVPNTTMPEPRPPTA